MAPTRTGAFHITLDEDMLLDVVLDHNITVSMAPDGSGMTPALAMTPYDDDLSSMKLGRKHSAAVFSPLAASGANDEPPDYNYLAAFGSSPMGAGSGDKAISWRRVRS